MAPNSNSDEHGVAVIPIGEADGDQQKTKTNYQQLQNQQHYQQQHTSTLNPGSIGEEVPTLPEVSHQTNTPLSSPSDSDSTSQSPSDSTFPSKLTQNDIASPLTTPFSTANLSEQTKLRIQVFGITIPFGCLAWIITHSFAASVAAILVLPFIAILQGSLAIIKYRVKYGNSAPHPKTPCHGLVKTEQDQDSTTTSSTPLRLLVIGDSLAVGVGQSKNSTPVMPETIAHQLSQAMDGRPVLWTCYGAPGASAGWIVRELERSIQQKGNPEYDWMMGPPIHSSTQQQQQNSKHARNSVCTLSTIQSEASEETVDVSLSFGDSSDFEDENDIDIAVDDEEMQSWQDQLEQERIHFDASQFGPFDIAVVLTGSNDLKAEFFPCLLKGRDVEFRKQAQLRGGSYGNELSRLLKALHKRMRLRIRTFRASVRESVEVATERVRERFGSCDGSKDCSNSWFAAAAAAATTTATQRNNYEVIGEDDGGEREKLDVEKTNLMTPKQPMEGIEEGTSLPCGPHSLTGPMVVLPGMPSRSLPIFHTWPLRWFTIPVVDIMDSHKRNMANKYPGEVLFVQPPTTEDLTDFVNRRGNHYNRKEKTNRNSSIKKNGYTVDASSEQHNRFLNLRSIKRWQAQDLEDKMKEYYHSQNETESTALPDNHRKQRFTLFSADGIHPNDEGYEFWGNFISDSIIQEMQRKESKTG